MERSIENTVANMADAFEQNIVDPVTKDITLKGMQELAEIFNAVPIELRGIVFRAFLEELDVRGIDCDVDQFKG